MRFDNTDDDNDNVIKPKSVTPTNDRAAKAIRTKLVLLFGMLLAVIILMKEAGKPERWEWMGFDKNGNPNSSNLNADETVELETEVSPLEVDASPTSENNALTSLSDGDSKRNVSEPITLGSNGQFNFRTSSNSDYPAAATKFWATTFKKLGPDRQRSLLKLLKQMRTGESSSDEKTQKELRSLLRLLDNQRGDFHQELFDQLALESDGSNEKAELANELFDSKEIWEKKIYTALDAATQGKDFTVAEQQAVFRLQATLDQFVFQQVQDKTTIGWAGDTSAWLRLWEKASNGLPNDVQKATRIELLGQPDFYRGKAIHVEGWIRSARVEKLKPDSQTGLEQYYELWVRPRESKLGPYNVYVKSLPDGFPKLSNQLVETNINAKIDGYFFKVRSYVAGDESVENSPVIIAPTVEVIPDTEFAAVNQWQPSRGFLIGAFLFIPLLATGIAWMAFQTSQTRKYVPGKKIAGKINDTLEGLTNDPTIQTDREKILALYEHEGDSDLDRESDSSEEPSLE